MYDERIEQLISAALADGVLTEKEKQILFKRAQEQGIDLDEFEMVLDARLIELQKAAKEKAAPKSDKYGNVRKCPACGAIVGAFKGICPECGFEFTEVDANLSSKRLYEALAKTKGEQKKIELIETFPIPNTKADLLEFLTALKPRVLDLKSPYAKAYFKKYSECIEKAKVAFTGDKQLSPFIEDFNKLRKSLSAKKWIKISLICVPIILAILIPISVKIAKNIAAEKERVAIQVEYTEKSEVFSTYLSEQKAEEAKSVLKSMRFPADCNDEFEEKSFKLIELYINQGDVYGAIDVYDNIASPEKALPIIQNMLISKGDYDNAWKYSGSYYTSGIHAASEYYSFMSKVVMYLCKKGKKQEARRFVNEYSNWFVANVDPRKDYVAKIDGHKWINEHYREFNSKTSKSRLLNMISEY